MKLFGILWEEPQGLLRVPLVPRVLQVIRVIQERLPLVFVKAFPEELEVMGGMQATEVLAVQLRATQVLVDMVKRWGPPVILIIIVTTPTLK